MTEGICPIFRTPCTKHSCAWFHVEANECAVTITANWIYNMAEQRKKNEEELLKQITSVYAPIKLYGDTEKE